MIVVYTKEKFPKEIFNTILTKKEVEQVGGLFIDHPELSEENCIVVERNTQFENPISDDLETIREMDRKELITLKNRVDLLLDGEKIEDGKIAVVEKPQSKYIKYTWDSITFVWEVVTTKEELVTLRRNKITQVQQIKRDLQDLIDFGDSELEIAQLEEQKAVLMKEIQELAELIKSM